MIQNRDMDHLANGSVIGRLPEEISWEGAAVRAYRDGGRGRGRENVLTAELFFLCRTCRVLSSSERSCGQNVGGLVLLRK